MFVSDVYQDVKSLLGNCDDSTVFQQITDAQELLANQTWTDASGVAQCWDALQGYLIATVQNGNLLVLPGDVETPIRLNINDKPAFARDRLFEFTPSGPGSAPGDRLVSAWQDEGTSPTYRLMDGVTPVQFKASEANALYLTGYDANGQRLENILVPADGTTLTPAFLRLDAVNKVSGDSVTLSGAPIGGAVATYSVYGPKDFAPSYRVIRLSTSGATVRMLYRRKTFKITSQLDYIPLTNRLAVLYMCKAIRRGLLEDNSQQEQLHYGRAVDLLKQDQTSRRLAESLAQTQQIDRTIGRNPNAGDLVTMLDLYDDAVDIFGPVGMDRIFEWTTEAVRILSRKGNWDSYLIYVVVPISGDTISLPANVDSYLTISVDGSPARFMGKLWEFTLNGPGESEVYTDATYEDRLDSPTFVVPSAPFRLSKNDTARVVTVVGVNTNGLQLSPYVVTANLSDSPFFSAISTVTVSAGNNSADYAQLYAETQLIASYAPTDTTPIYRRLKLRKGGATARVLARRKSSQIQSLGDLIPLRSRQSVVLMLKSLKAQLSGDAANAASFEQMAVQYLSEEQQVRSTAEAVASGSQVDKSLNLNTRARDVLTVFDIYDDCAGILGQVGRQNVFDAIAQATDLLQNASDGVWDSQLGFVDIVSNDGCTYVLPPEIGDVVAVNICGQPARPRNRWTEYHLNGPGERDTCCDCANGSFVPVAPAGATGLFILGVDNVVYAVTLGLNPEGRMTFDLSLAPPGTVATRFVNLVGIDGTPYTLSINNQNGPEVVIL